MTTRKNTLREGSIERKCVDGLRDLMNQAGDLINTISGDIDEAEAGTSVQTEIDTLREEWGRVAKLLTRLRGKATRRRPKP